MNERVKKPLKAGVSDKVPSIKGCSVNICELNSWTNPTCQRFLASLSSDFWLINHQAGCNTWVLPLCVSECFFFFGLFLIMKIFVFLALLTNVILANFWAMVRQFILATLGFSMPRLYFQFSVLQSCCSLYFICSSPVFFSLQSKECQLILQGQDWILPFPRSLSQAYFPLL